eukprot:3681119-Amphidinium_carterae.1
MFQQVSPKDLLKVIASKRQSLERFQELPPKTAITIILMKLATWCVQCSIIFNILAASAAAAAATAAAAAAQHKNITTPV